MPEIIQRGKSKFRPRARIIQTIGEELISNDNVALIELIKNSYDACSKKVEITFNPPLTEGKGSIIIKDYGTGMNLKTLKNAWMEPATIMKTKKQKSKNKRKLLGEKGIGRFASAKLSNQLTVITKTESDNEIVAKFNWPKFRDKKKYLDEINCTWEVRKPEMIEKQGTILVLDKLCSTWDFDKLNELRLSLSRMVNPFYPAKNFEIELFLPSEFSKLAGVITSPDMLGKPHYFIRGKVSASGHAEMEYFSKSKDAIEKIDKNLELKKSGKKSRKPKCGPFVFEFRVWDRDRLDNLASEVGSTLREIKKDLNEGAGVSIFRDDFRVLPYGTGHNDWLRLDLRRVQNPTLRISNNQIIGQVSIHSIQNPMLRDQSNREGIVESKAFSDMRELILQILKELELRRYSERPRDEPRNPEFRGLFSKIDITPIVELIKTKYFNDTQVTELVLKTDKELKEGLQKVQEVLSRYRRLTTLGQLLDVVLHDGNGVIQRIDLELSLLEKELKKAGVSEKPKLERITVLKNETKVLSELFKRLEPFSGRKGRTQKEIIIEDELKSVFSLFESQIEKAKIGITLPETKTKIKFNESDFEIMIVNLLQNSLYWLDTVSGKDKKISVEVVKKDEEIAILFSDNGPGVKEEYAPFIFDPYYSTKPDGVGLGLTIVGELATENNGILELINNGSLPGATFRITFR